ncbi:creatininase family protein [Halorientalis sp.]|uniref:creatininase family protein n=1 Tax=Halorientalis sp. TaxID=1931229 RepID=UPI0026177E5C|nr:creatininase family protein [Halorientalis sp.]
MHLAEATWTDVDAADPDLAVLPVGSTEQHGPHAPLGTDYITAEAVAEAGAERYEDDADESVVVAPPIPVGVAEEHRQFTGTLWVSEDTFRDYVRETVGSLRSHGWSKTVLVNGHGGNVAALRETAARVTRHSDGYAAAFTWFDAVDPEEVTMGHGGPLETSVLRHLHPELVNEDRLDEAAEGGADGWGEWESGVNLAHDSAEFSENGTVGDPRGGNTDLGKQLVEEAATALSALLERVSNRDTGLPDHR